MRPALVLPFDVQPDLAGTMDIQIPSLAWSPLPDGRFRRVYYLDGRAFPVDAEQAEGALRFFHAAPPGALAEELNARLRATFPRQVAELDLRSHPILRALHDRYGGVVIMHADPFEALVLTVLSQNRTGEIVRAVYPALDDRCRGVTARTLAGLPLEELRSLIRSAGPYKAPRLAETADRILADGGEEAFGKRVTGAPGHEALAYLESFPGVAHKTAACVLVFAAETVFTLPVDTHLFRVADRLGLARHRGTNNKTVREAVISRLLSYGPDLAPAHFLFLLLGRDTCTKAAPDCPGCFLRPRCPSAREGRGSAVLSGSRA